MASVDNVVCPSLSQVPLSGPGYVALPPEVALWSCPSPPYLPEHTTCLLQMVFPRLLPGFIGRDHHLYNRRILKVDWPSGVSGPARLPGVLSSVPHVPRVSPQPAAPAGGGGSSPPCCWRNSGEEPMALSGPTQGSEPIFCLENWACGS